MGLPRVYVIILSWNGLADTLECLGSLEKSSYPNAQIVLVDNGSSDGTVEAVRREHPSVHIIENRRNLGYAEGNNVGIRYALEQDGDYIFLLNDDAEVTPDAISALVVEAERNPKVGMVGPTNVSYYDRAIEYVGVSIDWKRMDIHEIRRSAANLPEILDSDAAHGCALLAKASVVRQIGLLDPAYYAYHEDADWSERARRAGFRVAVVPRARIFHKGTGDHGEGKSVKAYFLSYRNQHLFLRKHGNWRQHRLPFLKHSTRKTLELYRSLVEDGESDRADAIFDGWWAGLMGQVGAPRVVTPRWLRYLLHRRLGALMWLTGWLYEWDYIKTKRANTSGPSLKP